MIPRLIIELGAYEVFDGGFNLEQLGLSGVQEDFE